MSQKIQQYILNDDINIFKFPDECKELKEEIGKILRKIIILFDEGKNVETQKLLMEIALLLKEVNKICK